MIVKTTKIYKNNQTSIPKPIRERFNITQDTIVEWGIDENNKPTISFRDKVTIDDIVGIIKTEESSNSVDLKNEIYSENVYEKVLEKEDKCLICGSKGNLDPHHIIYTNKYDELHNSEAILAVLCHNCHHEYHKKYHYNTTFKTLMKFKEDFHRNECLKLKKQNKSLKRKNKKLRRNIRLLTGEPIEDNNEEV